MATSKTKKQEVTTITNGSGFLAVAFVVIFIIIFLALGYVLVISPRNETQSSPAPSPTPSVQSEQIIQIPFDYTVTNIDGSMVTLTGSNGDMLIPKDPTSVSVYNGTPESNTTISIEDLRVGNKVILKLIPGQIAWMYVVE